MNATNELLHSNRVYSYRSDREKEQSTLAQMQNHSSYKMPTSKMAVEELVHEVTASLCALP